MYGLQPGPLIFRDESGLIWTIIASMYIGNVALIILNLPLVGVFVKLLKMPKEIGFNPRPGGHRCLRDRVQPLRLMLLGIFGVIGYLMDKGGIPPALSILALVLVPLLEDNFRRMLQIRRGSFHAAADSTRVVVDHRAHGPGYRRTDHLPLVVRRRQLLADVSVA